MKIYADNAATTRVSDTALAAMTPCFQEIYGNPSSLHTPGQRAAEKLAAARAIFARNLHADPREITFTSGGSEADNQALRTAAALGEKRGKRHIVSTKFEHHAVLHTLQALEREGFEVTLLDIPPDGVVTAEQVRDAIRPDTCLVSVMFANNEIGTIQPIAEIGAVCRQAGVLFHTDAVQAAGHLPIDVEAMQVDLLSLSAHKFHGPKGVGVLYARRSIPLATLIHGGAQERGKRGGTEDIPGICGAAAAFDEACATIEQNAAYLTPLRDRLIAGLTAIPHTALNGDSARRLPGNVNVCFEGIEGESLLLLLDEKTQGEVRLGGIGKVISKKLEEATGIETRSCVLGHIQRGGSPCAYDRILGVRFGSYAVELVEKRKFSCMVALRGTQMTAVPIEEAVKTLKLVDPDCQLVRTARDLGVCFGD